MTPNLRVRGASSELRDVNSTHRRPLPFDLGGIDTEVPDPLCAAATARKRGFIGSEIGVLPESSTLDAGFPQSVVVDLQQEANRWLLLFDQENRLPLFLSGVPGERKLVVDTFPSLTFL